MPGLQLQRGKTAASSVKGRVTREQPQEKAGRRQKNESRKEGREQEIEKAGILFPDKEACTAGKAS